jgi:hypothetical protein
MTDARAALAANKQALRDEWRRVCQQLGRRLLAEAIDRLPPGARQTEIYLRDGPDFMLAFLDAYDALALAPPRAPSEPPIAALGAQLAPCPVCRGSGWTALPPYAGAVPSGAGPWTTETLYEIAAEVRKVGSLDNAVSYLRTRLAAGGAPGEQQP